jgi:hypothetical protein
LSIFRASFGVGPSQSRSFSPFSPCSPCSPFSLNRDPKDQKRGLIRHRMSSRTINSLVGTCGAAQTHKRAQTLAPSPSPPVLVHKTRANPHPSISITPFCPYRDGVLAATLRLSSTLSILCTLVHPSGILGPMPLQVASLLLLSSEWMAYYPRHCTLFPPVLLAHRESSFSPFSSGLANHGPVFYRWSIRSYRVPHIVQRGRHPASCSPPPPINSQDLRNLSFASHPAASGQGTGVMTITEEWGDQPSWKAAPDFRTPVSISFPISTKRAVSSHSVKLQLLSRY